MNRRNFLRSLAIITPAAAVAPTYFFAPIGGWHSDVIVQPSWDFSQQAYYFRYSYVGLDVGVEHDETWAVWFDKQGTEIKRTRLYPSESTDAVIFRL